MRRAHGDGIRRMMAGAMVAMVGLVTPGCPACGPADGAPQDETRGGSDDGHVPPRGVHRDGSVEMAAPHEEPPPPGNTTCAANADGRYGVCAGNLLTTPSGAAAGRFDQRSTFVVTQQEPASGGRFSVRGGGAFTTFPR